MSTDGAEVRFRPNTAASKQYIRQPVEHYPQLGQRLGLTPFSLKSHSQRAKRDQKEAFLLWQRKPH
jgi:hypothetical protein